jgi:hypothetical protein
VVELLELFCDDWIKCAELLELLAHLEGIKRLVRLVVDPPRRDALISFLSGASLPYRVSEFGLRTEFSTSLGDTFQRITQLRDHRGDCVLFVGSPEATAEAHAVELGGADALSCGEAYEYPACCAAAYVSLQEGTPWVLPFLQEVEPAGFFGWQTNKLASLYPPHLTIIPDFFPCSIRCHATSGLASQYEQLLVDAGLNELRDRITAELVRPLLVHDGWIYRFETLESSCAWTHGHVGTVSFVPLRSGPAQAPLRITGLSLGGGVVELVVSGADGAREAVVANGPLLRFSP